MKRMYVVDLKKINDLEKLRAFILENGISFGWTTTASTATVLVIDLELEHAKLVEMPMERIMILEYIKEVRQDFYKAVEEFKKGK